ncbi:unnamed protein product [Caenorhabditis auriculariae]|uniref:Uncharacterized protein n=1 Tax=Caenorhabditis auriculariae TaxID=2777116 RepID=A0A8S1H752_9PELO|nr:unnamed protein product [Caenorhabditis auriculariae]
MSRLQKRLDAYSKKLATLEEDIAEGRGAIKKLLENQSLAGEFSHVIERFHIDKAEENMQAEAKEESRQDWKEQAARKSLAGNVKQRNVERRSKSRGKNVEEKKAENRTRSTSVTTKKREQKPHQTGKAPVEAKEKSPMDGKKNSSTQVEPEGRQKTDGNKSENGSSRKSGWTEYNIDADGEKAADDPW